LAQKQHLSTPSVIYAINLQGLDDSVGVLVGLGLAAQVTGNGLDGN